MKDNSYRHQIPSARRYPFAIARILSVVVALCFNQAAFCLTDPDLEDGLPFSFEFPTAQDQTITLVTDTSASLHCCPLLGKVISPFGRRGGRSHTGVDVKLKRGDTVKVALKGVVKMASTYFGYGKLVVLKHPDGYETYYAHLSKCLVNKGDTVYAGQPLGLGGRTGRATTDHLHFEVRKNSKAQNPEQFFSFATGDLKKHMVLGVRELFIASGKKTESVEPKADKATHANTMSESTSGSASPDTYVTIQKGDTLYSLARRYGSTVKQLQEMNRLESSLLKIGMRIRVN